MNDSNHIMESLAGEPSGKRKKLPILLILLALILGVVIWRVRRAAGPVEATIPKDTVSLSQAPKSPESLKVAPPVPATPAPETTATTSSPTPVKAPVESVAVEKPHPIKHKRIHVKPVEEKKAIEEKTAAPEKTAVEEPAPPPPKPTVSKHKLKPEPAAKPEPAVVNAETPAKTDKKFVMEDQPMPEKPVLSEESKLAFNTLPKAVESKSDEVAAAPATSDAFKQAMDAYHRQDYENAIKFFGQLPRPTTKQRGDATRDQYVEGNFLLGVSLLKSDRAADAVNAFMAVLNYEKYYPLANMNLGICYVELKQYFKANKAFESVTRDQSYIDPAIFDDVMQRTKYFWALAWTRMYKTSKDPDKQAYYQQQAVMRWKDYQTWFGKNDKYRSENRKAEDYIKSLSAL